MKAILTITVLALTILGCSDQQTQNDGKTSKAETEVKTEKVFKQVAGFPIIKDTVKFISDLRQTFQLEVDESPYQKENEKISTFLKVNLYGSDKDFFLIEYDYGDGSGAAFPWKYQLLLTTDGKLVKEFSGKRFDFVEIFPGQNPFLLIVVATSKGNGGHEIYKLSADTLENVYEGYFNSAIRTYDFHQDHMIYEPGELELKVRDFNADGFNDVSFNGKIILLPVSYSVGNPSKKNPIELIFLFDQQTGHFKAKENYLEKYSLND